MSTGRETQTCPRRMMEFGPWDKTANLDTWETDRWHATKEEGDAYAADFAARHPGGSASNYWWQGPGNAPRTCSFCGGVNPEDAIALVESGWEVEVTGKSYKRYLQPPGYHRGVIEFIARLRGEATPDHPEAPQSPVPPVKLYVMHFTAEQQERFNVALRMLTATEQS